MPSGFPYTAGAIAAIAFNRPAVAMDGNVERVISRLRAIETPLPDAKQVIRNETAALTPAERPGDFAQALMDLGATVCAPKAPRCMLCPWRDHCAARDKGVEADLPRKAPKKAKPERVNVVYAHFDESGALLVETRPDKGLLGGMIGLPGPEWTKTPPTDAQIHAAAPVSTEWRTCEIEARHVFTHFTLRLTVFVGWGARTPGQRYLPVDEARDAAPTVMRKAIDIARDAFARLH